MNVIMDNVSTSVIIPAYNEEHGIGKVLDNLRLLGDRAEIIVVDDGSYDNTADLVKDYPSVILVSHEQNRGYGAALKTGIRAAKNDIITIIDADGTYPGQQIPELITVLHEGGYEMVVGARTAKEAKIPLLRRPAKWFLTRLANYLSGTRIPDLNSGLRIMKKSAVERFIRLLPDSFSFTTTITLAMLTNGLPVKYVPVQYFHRKGRSKIRPVRDTLNFVQLIIRTILYFNPLKVFLPLSLSLVIFAFLVLLSSWQMLGKPMDVTFGVILMTSVVVMAIGMLADLIDKRIQ